MAKRNKKKKPNNGRQKPTQNTKDMEKNYGVPEG